MEHLDNAAVTGFCPNQLMPAKHVPLIAERLMLEKQRVHACKLFIQKQSLFRR